MKRADKNSGTIRNLDVLISELSENAILSEQSMSFIRGGVGEGGDDIILIPPKPV